MKAAKLGHKQKGRGFFIRNCPNMSHAQKMTFNINQKREIQNGLMNVPQAWNVKRTGESV